MTMTEEPRIETEPEAVRRAYDRRQRVLTEAAALGIDPDSDLAREAMESAAVGNAREPLNALLCRISSNTGRSIAEIVRSAKSGKGPSAEEDKLHAEAAETLSRAHAAEIARTCKEYEWELKIKEFEDLQIRAHNARGIVAQQELDWEAADAQINGQFGLPYAPVCIELIQRMATAQAALPLFRQYTAALHERLAQHLKTTVEFARENDVPREAWADLETLLSAITAKPPNDDEHDPTIEQAEARANRKTKNK